MKRHLFFIFVALLLVSCEKNIVVEKECEHECEHEQEQIFSYKFNIDTHNQIVGQESGSFKIRVSSNHAWEATIKKPENDYIVKLEIDKCSGNGDAIVTVSYSKPHRKFYYSPGNKETGYIVFHHKKGSNKNSQPCTTTCTIQRVRKY